jgi:hypothetical protein
MRHDLIVEQVNDFSQLFFDSGYGLTETFIDLFAKIFESAAGFVFGWLIHGPSFVHLLNTIYVTGTLSFLVGLKASLSCLNALGCRIDWRSEKSGRWKGLLTNSLYPRCRLGLIFVLVSCSSGLSQSPLQPTPLAIASAALPDAAPLLPDTPIAQPPAEQAESRQMTMAPIPPARKYAQVIEPGQQAYKLTATDKLVFSFAEIARPVTILPSLYSAGYEHLFETDPKYGHDSGAFGEQFGASMLRRATLRVFSDGIFPSVFHQDPRYYRIAKGNAFHRSLLSARQAIFRRGDNGKDQINYSGFAGRAAMAALTATYYPEPSVTAGVVGSTFAFSILTDAGGDLVLEFLPNVIRKFPIMSKLRLE